MARNPILTLKSKGHKLTKLSPSSPLLTVRECAYVLNDNQLTCA